MKRTLTKSRFKLAMDCPAKLYYTGKKEYPDTKLDDTFLQALAEGGFQVGELAKLYYPGGHNITSLDYDSALDRTNELLKSENIVIFEAAIKFKNLFIRVDVLEKKGSTIKLIEVKAKSIDMENHENFFSKSGKIKSVWSPYLYDTAFQKYVLTCAFPDYNINAYLLLANKNAVASVDGLNQRFFLQKDNRGRTSVKVTDTGDTGNKLLALINVDEEADVIYDTPLLLEENELSFEEYVRKLSDSYSNDIKIKTPIGLHCAKCEYTATDEEEQKEKISGFKECWKEQARLNDKELKQPLVFELWNFRGKQKLIDDQTYFIKDIDVSIFPEKESSSSGLTDSERKILQIEKIKNNDNTPYLDIAGLCDELKLWKFPLHFIDFETTMTAIPFNKGKSPYEGIAFQFSHHVVNEDGTVEHKGEYLNTVQGVFPNYDFIRELKNQLEIDDGSVFRYATHENTYLAMIHRQLSNELNPVPGKDELLSFIETISHSNDNSVKKWKGQRDMIDLLEVVKRFFYHPGMKGSNSIKVVLPAVMESEFIQNKYSQPIYGGNGIIKSCNFKDQIWIQKDTNGKIISPYKLLPPLFEGINNDQLEEFLSEEELANGGAAMTAYAKMQFTEMTQLEKEKISAGLLRYCELDTLAMVMIYEYFQHEVSINKSN